MSSRLRYAIITAARDEATMLPQLAQALASQTQRPEQWVVVESGSSDDTADVVAALAASNHWIQLVRLGTPGPRKRGAPVVRALHAGLEEVRPDCEIVVNVDADVTMGTTYFERLLRVFENDPTLGIASGSAWELAGGTWRQRFVTGGTVWGATRAYRRAALADVLPLEERHGWDGIDQLRARAKGWTSRTLVDLPFYHHRPEGALDDTRRAHWWVNGQTAHFMGYRPTYLLARALRHLPRDPYAAWLVAGYASAAVRRLPQLQDRRARAVLRDDQRWRRMPTRWRESRGAAARPTTQVRP